MIRRRWIAVLVSLLALTEAADAQTITTIRRLPPPASTPPASSTPAQTNTPLRTGNAAALNRTEIVPPARVATAARPGAVILRGGSNSSVVRSLTIKREIALPQLRSAPVLRIGRISANMQPFLTSPRALFNVSQALRARPNLAQVTSEDTRVWEVDRGIVVHSFVAYRIRPGACTDPARRGALSQIGAPCVRRQDPAARAAAFADPANPRYIESPRMRAYNLNRANAGAAAMHAEMATDLATLRAMLKDPAKAAEIDAERGAGEAARLAALSDDDLEAEVINSGEVAVEQNAFLPVIDPANPAPKAEAKPKSPKETNVDTPLDPEIFLTGFTLDGNYEWHQRIEKTIKRCLVGCSKTYYAEASVNFGYAFGMRFPIKVSGLYSHRPQKASVRIDLSPINGGENEYRAAGLPESKLYEGKELVAQISAGGRFAADLPAIPDIDVSGGATLDFTKLLGGDFAGGQFTPPAPGTQSPPELQQFFEDIDLLGGIANLGVAGAKVFPGLKVTLKSGDLHFMLKDLRKSGDPVPVVSGTTVDLGINPANELSEFVISDPVYNLGLEITPGIKARLFIDLAVWSHDWDFPVWLPQLAINVPAGGVNFSCHAQTVCARYYGYSPTGHVNDSDTGYYQLKNALAAWRDGWVPEKSQECADETCRIGVRFVGQGYFYGALGKHTETNPKTFEDADIQQFLKGADAEAKNLVNEAQARQTTGAAKSFAALWTAFWGKQCADMPCLSKVKGIAKFAEAEINAQQKLNPDLSTNEAVASVGKKFRPVFESEVQASKSRAAAQEAAEAARAARFGGKPAVQAIQPAPQPVRLRVPLRTN